MTNPEIQPHGGRLLPALVLGALVLVILAGVWLFPRVAAYMSRQDCIASGHVNCGE